MRIFRGVMPDNLVLGEIYTIDGLQYECFRSLAGETYDNVVVRKSHPDPRCRGVIDGKLLALVTGSPDDKPNPRRCVYYQ